MTVIAAPVPTALVRDVIPERLPDRPVAAVRTPVDVRAEDCDCASFFGRLMMFATRNVPR